MTRGVRIRAAGLAVAVLAAVTGATVAAGGAGSGAAQPVRDGGRAAAIGCGPNCLGNHNQVLL